MTRLPPDALDALAAAVAAGQTSLEEELTEAMAPLLATVVKGFTYRPHLAPHAEDFMAEAYLSGIRYARRYQTRRGKKKVRFSDYICQCVRYDLIKFARSFMSRVGGKLPDRGQHDLSEPLFRDTTPVDALGDSLSGSETDRRGELAAARLFIMRFLNQLQPEERKVLMALYGIPEMHKPPPEPMSTKRYAAATNTRLGVVVALRDSGLERLAQIAQRSGWRPSRRPTPEDDAT